MGERILPIARSPAVLYKTARAWAGTGKEKKTLERLKEAIDGGFDDGKRLDGEKSFDALRALPEFAALRARCR